MAWSLKMAARVWQVSAGAVSPQQGIGLRRPAWTTSGNVLLREFGVPAHPEGSYSKFTCLSFFGAPKVNTKPR